MLIGYCVSQWETASRLGGRRTLAVAGTQHQLNPGGEGSVVAAPPGDAFATEAETHPARGGGLKPAEMVSSSEAGGGVGQGPSNCMFVYLQSRAQESNPRGQ